MLSWRIVLVALSLLTSFAHGRASSSAASSSLMTSARRRTEDVAAFEYDLSSFSLHFEKCQYVKSFDDEIAENEDYEGVFATQHFVVFKMCPSDECDTCDGVHGEYVVEIDNYLMATVEYEKEQFEYMCNNCNERCNNDGDYCSGCGKLCYQWANLEANGYVDASKYMECQKLDVQNNDDNNGDDEVELYVGPKCSSDGKSIKVGLFSDEDCFEPVTDMDVEEMIGAKLSYYALSSVVANADTGNKVCLSCKESDNNANDGDNADEDEVNEMCEEIYASSAKCESVYGLESGFIDVNRENGDYENQVENEFMACTFINSLVWNSYTETGEINYMAEQDEVIREVTATQAVSLSMIGLAFVALLGAAYYMDMKIERLYPKIGLSAQGGVVA
jgi:hypothetical protein